MVLIIQKDASNQVKILAEMLTESLMEAYGNQLEAIEKIKMGDQRDEAKEELLRTERINLDLLEGVTCSLFADIGEQFCELIKTMARKMIGLIEYG